ncbi:MAG: ABC transporter permease [Candidatus Bathyarchaeia archaeon]|jgi:peptide/nickel transport system permease protein
MSYREEKIKFTLKRFKGFWKEFSRSKQGILGLIIIIFYIILAVMAPLLSPYEPYAPKHEGHYPAGINPKIATRLALPIWYKTVLGMQDLSENFFPIKNHEMNTPDDIIAQWKWTQPSNTLVTPSANKGDRGEGCIEINFTSSATVEVWTSFNYEYKNKPMEFTIHISVFTENASKTSLKVSLERDGKETYSERIHNVGTDRWAHSFVNSGESPTLMAKTFPEPGEYVFKIIVTSEANNTVRLDNIDLLIYGEAFGLLGTDGSLDRPRDIFTTLIHGTRISLIVGLLSAIISTFLGLFIGLVSGYIGGIVDEALMRFADFLLVLPGLPLLIVLIVTTSASFWNLILIISLLGWMTFSRQIRSMVLSLKERPFIEAARVSGAGTSYIISKHLMPNVFALVYITLATSVPGAIIAEASISWLGLFDPTIVSWGRMLYEFTNSGVIIRPFQTYWFWVIPPGIAIMLLAVAFILIGYALDEILNPKLRRR